MWLRIHLDAIRHHEGSYQTWNDVMILVYHKHKFRNTWARILGAYIHTVKAYAELADEVRARVLRAGRCGGAFGALRELDAALRRGAALDDALEELARAGASDHAEVLNHLLFRHAHAGVV